jgi:hypothetical protein
MSITRKWDEAFLKTSPWLINNDVTLSRLISLNGNHFPTNTITGLPNRSYPLW